MTGGVGRRKGESTSPERPMDLRSAASPRRRVVDVGGEERRSCRKGVQG